MRTVALWHRISRRWHHPASGRRQEAALCACKWPRANRNSGFQLECASPPRSSRRRIVNQPGPSPRYGRGTWQAGKHEPRRPGAVADSESARATRSASASGSQRLVEDEAVPGIMRP
jgi:hypothetical protein